MTSKDQTKKVPAPKSPRRSSGLVSFGADVRKLLGPLLGKKGLMQADIMSHWTDILGPSLASGVTPFSLSFSKHSGGKTVLTVKVFSGAYAVEITARKEQIIERINSYFGYDAINDLRIMQGGTFSPPPSLPREPKLSARQIEDIYQIAADIETDSLRESIIKLGLLLADPKKD